MNNMNEKPSYYAIVPANVRYDTRLKANAKLLYGEITALCSREGYCWASDSYFAQLYSVGRQTVNGWIHNLVACGYLSILHTGKQDERKITLTAAVTEAGCQKNATPLSEKNDTPVRKTRQGVSEKNDRGCQKNATHINTVSTTQNTTPVLHKPNSHATHENDSDIGVCKNDVLSKPPPSPVSKPAAASPPLTEREPSNLQEQVLKSYLLNFKALYEQGKLQTPQPLLNYAHVGKLIKNLSAQFDTARVISALTRAMDDPFIVRGGYTLATILSANVFNGLLNGKPTPPQRPCAPKNTMWDAGFKCTQPKEVWT